MAFHKSNWMYHMKFQNFNAHNELSNIFHLLCVSVFNTNTQIHIYTHIQANMYVYIYTTTFTTLTTYISKTPTYKSTNITNTLFFSPKAHLKVFWNTSVVHNIIMYFPASIWNSVGLSVQTKWILTSIKTVHLQKTLMPLEEDKKGPTISKKIILNPKWKFKSR